MVPAPEEVGDYRPPPRTFVDDEQRRVRVADYTADDREQLAAMYRVFDPTDRSQGLPPLDNPGIREWLDSVLEGISVVAWHGGGIVGHVVFVPDGDGRYEMAVFVHGEYQSAGIGSTLVRAGLARLQVVDADSVWLSVTRWNEPALRLYRKVGFDIERAHGTEMELVREL